MKHLIVNHHRPLTLWLGMYAITSGIFFYETGDINTSLTLGLFSASLKTLWSVIHGRIFGSKPCKRCVALEEGFAN